MANADKRSTHTDALETLGTIIGSNEARDAIHLAVEPVVAGHDLMPGDHITLKDGKAIKAMPGSGLGIVDPFIDGVVTRGERFWLVVYPRQITSLRHVWAHPAFPAAEVRAEPVDESTTAVSRRWIENFAASIPLDYATIMDGAADYVRSTRKGGYGEYLCFGGLLEGESVPDEFWPHYEVVTGEKVEEAHRGSFFSCSC